MGDAWGVKAVESDIGLDALEQFKEFCDGRDEVELASFWEYQKRQPADYRGAGAALYRETSKLLSAELLLEYLETGRVSYCIYSGDSEIPRSVERLSFNRNEVELLQGAVNEMAAGSGALAGYWREAGGGESYGRWRDHLRSVSDGLLRHLEYMRA